MVIIKKTFLFLSWIATMLNTVNLHISNPCPIIYASYPMPMVPLPLLYLCNQGSSVQPSKPKKAGLRPTCPPPCVCVPKSSLCQCKCKKIKKKPKRVTPSPMTAFAFQMPPIVQPPVIVISLSQPIQEKSDSNSRESNEDIDQQNEDEQC